MRQIWKQDMVRISWVKSTCLAGAAGCRGGQKISLGQLHDVVWLLFLEHQLKTCFSSSSVEEDEFYHCLSTWKHFSWDPTGFPMPRVKTEGSVARRIKWSSRSSLFQIWLHHPQLPPLPLSSFFLDSGCCALLEILRQLSEVLKHLQTLWGMRVVISREIKWKRKWYCKKKKRRKVISLLPSIVAQQACWHRPMH